MSDIKNVSASKPKLTGCAYVAPIGTTVPTDATTELDPAFKALGYNSEDGLTNSNSMETEDIKAWGGQIVYSAQTEKTDTFQTSFIESLNADVLKVIYGDDNVTVDESQKKITVKANANEIPTRVVVFDMVLNGDAVKRIVVPNAKVSELGVIVYVDNDVIKYEVTFKALPDSKLKTHYEYISLGA